MLRGKLKCMKIVVFRYVVLAQILLLSKQFVFCEVFVLSQALVRHCRLKSSKNKQAKKHDLTFEFEYWHYITANYLFFLHLLGTGKKIVWESRSCIYMVTWLYSGMITGQRRTARNTILYPGLFKRIHLIWLVFFIAFISTLKIECFHI